MIIEEHIKEAISSKYIELIAAFNGYTTSSVKPDYGTDLSIIEVDFQIENEKKAYLDTGRELKLQLKATTEKYIIDKNNIIKYDLNATTFNSLIKRRYSGQPLVLILFILPENKTDWINISNNELITKKCAYWYFPKPTDTKTKNLSSKRISINKNNIISNKSFNRLFEKYS